MGVFSVTPDSFVRAFCCLVVVFAGDRRSVRDLSEMRRSFDVNLCRRMQSIDSSRGFVRRLKILGIFLNFEN